MQLNASPSTHTDDEARALRMAAEAREFRSVLSRERRSTTWVRLFDYLLEHADDTRAPKEIEIAMAVFSKSGTFDTSQHSLVRGHVHRLRQRLESFNEGRPGPILAIPRGEYRVVLSEGTEAQAPPPPAAPPAMPAFPRRARLGVQRGVLLLVLASVIGWTVLFVTSRSHKAPSPLGKTAFWQPIVAAAQLPLIVVGDVYMVAESMPGQPIRRLSMHPSIQSDKDLGEYRATHPSAFATMHDRDVYRTPEAAAVGAAAMLPLVASMRSDKGMAEIVPASKLSPERISGRNLVVIAHLTQLGALRLPLLQLSGIAPGPNFDELEDLHTGKVYRAQPSTAAEARTPGGVPAKSFGYDYGYVARYAAPSGALTMVLSGIEDLAVTEMTRVVADKAQLDLLARKTGSAQAYEALYQIRTLGGVVYDTRLVVARPMRRASETIGVHSR